jgi:AcrR family transcriptional regulator
MDDARSRVKTRTKTAKSLHKREQILLAAASLFRQKGYAETTLADVAASANTFAGSLYYHFPSKEHLVEEVLNLGTLRIAGLVKGAVEDLPLGSSATLKLNVAMHTHVKLSLGRDHFASAYWKIIDQVPSEVRERHMSRPRSYGRYWKELIKSGQEANEFRGDLDPRVVSLLLLGSTIYAIDWYDENGVMDTKQLADILFEMCLGGIRAPAVKEGQVARKHSASRRARLSRRRTSDRSA